MPFASPARTDHTCDNAFRSTVRHTIHEGSPARQRIFHGSVLTHSPAVKSQSFVGSAAGATALRLLTKVRRMEPRASRHRLLPLCRCREERGRAFESTPSQAHTQWNSPKNPYLRRRHRKTGPASELSSELLVSCRNTKSAFFKNLTALPPDAVTNTHRAIVTPPRAAAASAASLPSFLAATAPTSIIAARTVPRLASLQPCRTAAARAHARNEHMSRFFRHACSAGHRSGSAAVHLTQARPPPERSPTQARQRRALMTRRRA